ncbi:hypothetical protein [Salegentibacter sediminis]|uniref:hypothetical protein n=1 Tax=Salegentibacter sediminis TaxID=1930251 RepID=UPI0009C09DA3|nr:hypothetical protein [Salegentibacter sediminis]
MRKFLKYALGLFLVAAILMVSLDYFYSYAFRNSEPRLKVQKILQLKDQHFDIAFFGSSRTKAHIDCNLIEELTGKSCINLGVSGATITDMNFIMKAVVSNNITFNKAFMQIDYNYNLIGLTKLVKAGIVPFLTDSKIKNVFPEREKGNPYYWLPFYRYFVYNRNYGIRNLFASIIQKKSNIEINLSITPNEGQGLYVDGSFPGSLIDKNEDLNEMIDFTNNIGKPLVLFTAPYCKKVENRYIIDSIQKRLPELKNYISVFDKQQKYFFNCGHLNKTGAREFTRILTGDNLME